MFRFWRYGMKLRKTLPIVQKGTNDRLRLRLQPVRSVLLVDVPVALLLLSVLEDHGDTEDEDDVGADNTKGSGKDSIQVLVGER